MPPTQNLVGRTFNRLSVLRKDTDPRNTGKPRYICRCSCKDKTIVSVAAAKLTSPSTPVRSCGCLRRERWDAYNETTFVDLTGKIFHMWTVLAQAPSRKTKTGAHRMWLCRCNCLNATVREVKANALRKGLSKSCGCIRGVKKRNKPYKTLPPGEVGFARLFSQYQKSAKERHIGWALTVDQFRSLVTASCFYCNVPPSRLHAVRLYGGVINDHNSFWYNGIDRINPGGDYTLENCVSCCSAHNYGKNASSLEDFSIASQHLITAVTGQSFEDAHFVYKLWLAKLAARDLLEIQLPA